MNLLNPEKKHKCKQTVSGDLISTDTRVGNFILMRIHNQGHGCGVKERG